MKRANDEDAYTMHFGQFASKLERHLRTNGIPCRDADVIIEEISALYVEKIKKSAGGGRFLSRILGKHGPAEVFVDSAYRAIERHLPEAKFTFGSQNEIAKCIR